MSFAVAPLVTKNVPSFVIRLNGLTIENKSNNSKCLDNFPFFLVDFWRQINTVFFGQDVNVFHVVIPYNFRLILCFCYVRCFYGSGGFC